MSAQTVLGFATALFGIGLYGLLQRRSLVAMLISLELMLAAVSINIIALTSHTGTDPVMGQVVVLILIGVAAAEAAVALSLFVAIHRSAHDIDVERLSEQQG
ncbi:MAG TPA: NADH-quinone oxidoreductase subunit NuoK [Gemmatimonadales bacterium]